MVRRFLLQCTWLALPILGLFALVAWIDPYGLYHTGGPVPRALKEKNLYHSGRTMPFSNMMWKLADFRREPVPDILLGDSRLSYFDLDSLRGMTGDRYYNLGVPGGNYVTMDHLFHFADSLTELRHVMVQVSFRGLHASQHFDIYAEPASLLARPWSYVYNRRVIEAAGLNLYSLFFPDAIAYDVPGEDQWQAVLDAERAAAEAWEMDTAAFGTLQHIADRCRADGAQLVFVEYPTHPDLQRIMREAGLEEARAAYLQRLGAMAPVIDLDQPGLFPADRSFWRDPLHLTIDAQRALIPRIWGAQ